MKLLLTSSGLTNTSITEALSTLVGKSLAESNLAFIPTAANIEEGDKGWIIDDLNNFRKAGFKEIDIVDISALEKKFWLPRLEHADILLFGGGNAYYLMYWLIKSGLNEILPKLLEKKVYVGISAGSMVTTTNFYPTFNHDVGLYDEAILSEKEIKYGLSFVHFHIIPHLNSKGFPKVRTVNIKEYADETTEVIYAIDNSTAVQVDGENISVITEGKWEKFN